MPPQEMSCSKNLHIYLMCKIELLYYFETQSKISLKQNICLYAFVFFLYLSSILNFLSFYHTLSLKS